MGASGNAMQALVVRRQLAQKAEADPEVGRRHPSPVDAVAVALVIELDDIGAQRVQALRVDFWQAARGVRLKG